LKYSFLYSELFCLVCSVTVPSSPQIGQSLVEFSFIK
jgi:hypothetical protein